MERSSALASFSGSLLPVYTPMSGPPLVKGCWREGVLSFQCITHNLTRNPDLASSGNPFFTRIAIPF